MTHLQLQDTLPAPDLEPSHLTRPLGISLHPGWGGVEGRQETDLGDVDKKLSPWLWTEHLRNLGGSVGSITAPK